MKTYRQKVECMSCGNSRKDGKKFTSEQPVRKIYKCVDCYEEIVKIGNAEMKKPKKEKFNHIDMFLF